MEDVVMVAAARTAVGKFGGALAKVAAPDLGATVIKALLERVGISGDMVDEVILGQVLTAGGGQNPARQAVIKSGLPIGVPAFVVGKVCGSGLKATHLAAQAIRCGDADIVIAGGQENMSASPHVVMGSRDGQRMGDLEDGQHDDQRRPVGCRQPLPHGHHCRKRCQKIRHLARGAGCLRRCIPAEGRGRAKGRPLQGRDRPWEIVSRKGKVVFDTDEFIKHGTTVGSLAGLKPAFEKAGS